MRGHIQKLLAAKMNKAIIGFQVSKTLIPIHDVRVTFQGYGLNNGGYDYYGDYGYGSSGGSASGVEAPTPSPTPIPADGSDRMFNPLEHPGMGMMPGMMAGMMPPAGAGGAQAGNAQGPPAGGQQVAGTGAGAATGAGNTGSQAAAPQFPPMNPFMGAMGGMNPMMMAAAAGAGDCLCSCV